IPTMGGQGIHPYPAIRQGGTVNLAYHKTASQSSTYQGAEASRAVDGNKDSIWAGNSVTHTDPGASDPWWELDLEVPSVIRTIIVYNSDYMPERLDGALVSLHRENSNGVREMLEGSEREIVGTSQPVHIIDFTDAVHVATRVRIRLPGAGKVLTMTEVEVMGFRSSGFYFSPFTDDVALDPDNLPLSLCQGL
ncbi:hypothetical protein THAOC_32423, partial [Thalassiosira oceanica]